MGLSRWAVRRPWSALALSLLATLALSVPALSYEEHLAPTSIDVRDSPSDRVETAAARELGRSTTIPILLEGPERDLVTQGTLLVGVLRAGARREVVSPFAGDAAPALRPRPGRAVVLVTAPTGDAFDGDTGEALRALVDATIRPPVRSSASGYSLIGGAIAEESVAAAHDAEKIAIPILLVVLLLVFRSPIAAAIPLLLGVATVVSGLGIVSLLAREIELSDAAGSLASMMGLALGVDYSLLLVSRFREELEHDPDPARAALAAAATAGRTATFAAVALVAIMLGALVLAPANFLTSAAVAVIAVSGLALLGALVTMPAVLRLLGARVDRFRLGRRRAGGGRWLALAGLAQRRPVLTALPVLAAVLALAPAAIAIDTSPPDPRVLPDTSRARQDADRVARALGPGWVASFSVYAEPSRLPTMRPAIARDPSVLTVLPGPGTERLGSLTVVPRSPPTDVRTVALRTRLEGLDADVGGVAAQLHDLRTTVDDRLPVIILVLSLITIAMLAITLRAIVLPLISVLLNLVTVAAAVGVLALVSTGDDPLLGGSGAVDQLSLMGIFAVVFALSIDYQMFILARVREEYERGGGIGPAVRGAVARTAGVVTGAAAIMGSVFFAFGVVELQTIRQVGVALLAAVAIDATAVRLVLLPAAMTLAGRSCFWLPAALERRLPANDAADARVESLP